MDIKTIKLRDCTVTARVFGEGKINLVTEAGLASSCAEWWRIAEKLSKNYTVLTYERAKISKVPRTPKNIANELNELIEALPHENKVIIVAHSQGAVYAQQFARLYPEKVRGIVFVDPATANDDVFTKELTPAEQKASGFDKTDGIKTMLRLSKMHMGGLIKTFMRKAPPFYYYDSFPKETEKYILSEYTTKGFFESANDEYKFSHDEKEIAELKNKEGFPNVPLVLITHSSDYEIKEIENFGHSSEDCAVKIENLWQKVMRGYLEFSTLNRSMQAKCSGHYVHLTEPKLIIKALEYIEKFPI